MYAVYVFEAYFGPEAQWWTTGQKGTAFGLGVKRIDEEVLRRVYSEKIREMPCEI
jgi:hypothetical protein